MKHIRENKLRMTFTDALGQAQSQPDGVSNQKEARRLAFYLFWNVRTEYDRSGPLRFTLDLVAVHNSIASQIVCISSGYTAVSRWQCMYAH